MSDSASVEKSMDTQNKSGQSECVLEQESWRRLAMGEIMPDAELAPREKSGDAVREDTATTMDAPASNVICVKEALPADTLPFVNHGAANIQISASTRALEERPIHRALPPTSHQSSSAVDNLVEVPHPRRPGDRENGQRSLAKMDDDSESSEATGTGLTQFHVPGQLQKNLIRILQDMDERSDYFPDSDDSCDMTSESSDSDDALSYQSTNSQEWPDLRDSCRSQTPTGRLTDQLVTDSRDFILNQRQDCATSASFLSSKSTTQRSFSQSLHPRNSSRSQTSESTISARSLYSRSNSQRQLDQSEDSSRSLTPVSNCSTLSCRSSNSQLQPESAQSSRSQTSDSTPESVSHVTSPRSSNFPSHIIANDLQARAEEGPDCRQSSSRNFKPVAKVNLIAAPSQSGETRVVTSAISTSWRKENQHNPSTRENIVQSDKEMAPVAGYLSDDSDCIIGPFPLFAQGSHTENLTRMASLGSCSIKSNSSVIQPGSDLSEDSDCIVGPFPLFASRPSEQAFKRTASPSSSSIGSNMNLSLVQSHDDLEPEAYFSDDSDCIVGPFPLFTPRRPKEASERTASQRSINTGDSPSLSAGSPGYSSDDSDCIVGPFPLFSPAAPKEPCSSQSCSSLSECASEEFCGPKSTAPRTPVTCWDKDSNDTMKDKVKTKGRLLRSFGSLRKGFRRLGQRLSFLATTCFPVAKR